MPVTNTKKKIVEYLGTINCFPSKHICFLANNIQETLADAFMGAYLSILQLSNQGQMEMRRPTYFTEQLWGLISTYSGLGDVQPAGIPGMQKNRESTYVQQAAKYPSGRNCSPLHNRNC